MLFYIYFMSASGNISGGRGEGAAEILSAQASHGAAEGEINHRKRDETRSYMADTTRYEYIILILYPW